MAIPNHLLVAISGWAQRVVGIVSNVFTIRFLTEGLGVDNYGAFAMLIWASSLCSLADFGLAGSLQNYISECRGRNLRYEKYIGTALFGGLTLLLFFGICLLLFRGPLTGLVWSPAFNFIGPSNRVLYFSIAISLGLIWAIGVISFRIWIAEHRGYVPALLLTVTSVLSTFFIWRLTRHPPANFSLCLLAYFGPMTAAALCAYFYHATRAFLAYTEIRSETISQMGNRSIKMWLITGLGMLMTQTDLFIVSKFAPQSIDIVTYNFTQKIFNVAYQAYGALLLSILPLLAEMVHRHDKNGLEKMLRKYVGLGLGFLIAFFLVSPLVIPPICRFLSPKELVSIPSGLTLLFCIAAGCRIWNDSFCAVLMSANEFRFFFIWLPVAAFITVSAEILLGKRFGVYGVLIGVIIGATSTICWASFRSLKQLLNRPADLAER
jgi:O-antigen/teichoic acid export membrane protein